jgi:hypothetical protein
MRVYRSGRRNLGRYTMLKRDTNPRWLWPGDGIYIQPRESDTPLFALYMGMTQSRPIDILIKHEFMAGETPFFLLDCMWGIDQLQVVCMITSDEEFTTDLWWFRGVETM